MCFNAAWDPWLDSEDFLFRLSMLILSEILRNEFKHSTIIFHL